MSTTRELAELNRVGGGSYEHMPNRGTRAGFGENVATCGADTSPDATNRLGSAKSPVTPASQTMPRDATEF